MDSGKGYNGRERRRFARVKYPAGRRPRLTVAGRDFEVADISARGLKFIAASPDDFTSDLQEVRGTIEFSDRKSREIRGAIIRIERREDSPETGVALFLFEDWGIPAERIDQEREAKDD